MIMEEFRKKDVKSLEAHLVDRNVIIACGVV